ncbi:MAG TPA: complex I NDUFA9 subunit family protein [Burkholderiales bacterium]|nr:complex I NDUFA9 subunit family protein [Burkholderiales bacterium]
MKFHRICVLGGSGFVGSAIVQALAAQGRYVRVLTRNRERSKELIVLPTVDVVECNVHDQAELNGQFAGMDAIINLIGILHESRPGKIVDAQSGSGEYFENHVMLPHKVLTACAANGIQRLLHMSALGASIESRSAYQRSKAYGEQLVRTAGSSSDCNGLGVADFVRGCRLYPTIFRPSVIFGRGDSFLSMFARIVKLLPIIPLAQASARFQPVWVENVAGAFTESLDNPATFGATYNVCGPKIYTLRELVEFVARTVRVTPHVIPLGSRLSYLQAAIMEWMPGKKLMTRDNFYAMLTDNVCDGAYSEPPGMKPAALEAIAAEYLDGATPRGRYTLFRGRAGR